MMDAVMRLLGLAAPQPTAPPRHAAEGFGSLLARAMDGEPIRHPAGSRGSERDETGTSARLALESGAASRSAETLPVGLAGGAGAERSDSSGSDAAVEEGADTATGGAGSGKATDSAGSNASGRTTAASAVRRADGDVGKLDPELQARLGRVIRRMKDEHGHRVAVVEGLRSGERQDYLFAQGRTRPGPKVTWTTESQHELGRAADLMVDGGYDDPVAYQRLQRIASEEGLRTLGPNDPGHLELWQGAGAAALAMAAEVVGRHGAGASPGDSDAASRGSGAGGTGAGTSGGTSGGRDGSRTADVPDRAGMARSARVARVAVASTAAVATPAAPATPGGLVRPRRGVHAYTAAEASGAAEASTGAAGDPAAGSAGRDGLEEAKAAVGAGAERGTRTGQRQVGTRAVRFATLVEAAGDGANGAAGAERHAASPSAFARGFGVERGASHTDGRTTTAALDAASASPTAKSAEAAQAAEAAVDPAVARAAATVSVDRPEKTERSRTAPRGRVTRGGNAASDAGRLAAAEAAETARTRRPISPVRLAQAAADDAAGAADAEAQPRLAHARSGSSDRRRGESGPARVEPTGTTAARSAFAPLGGRPGAATPAPVASPAPVAGPHQAERVEALDSLQQQLDARPIQQVSLRVGEGPDAARVRVGVRAEQVRAELTTESQRLGELLTRDLPDLARALERHGLEAESMLVRRAERLAAVEPPSLRPSGSVQGADSGTSARNHNEGTGGQRAPRDGGQRPRRDRNEEGTE